MKKSANFALLFETPVIQRTSIPLLMFAITAAVCSVVLPDGINQLFSQQLAALTLAAALMCGLLFRHVASDDASIGSNEELSRKDFWLLLLPLAPIFEYVQLNQEILLFWESTALIVGFAAVLALCVLALPRALRKWCAAGRLRILLLAFASLVLWMPSLARAFAWHERGSILVQLAIFLALTGVLWLLYKKERWFLYALSAFSCTFSLFAAQPSESVQSNAETGIRVELAQAIAAEQTTPERLPSIFLLTYDSYVANETMLQYGIDNSAQERHLSDLGFTHYPATYSIAAGTLASMSAMLGHEDEQLGLAGFGAVNAVLEQAGYATEGVFYTDYFFRGVGIGYDRGFPQLLPSSLVLAGAILEGEFRHDVGFWDPTRSEFLDAKREALLRPTDSPRFFYSHTGPGHSQNSGKCLADETQRFAQRLEIANLEMRTDLDTVLKRHPDAIVIVNGDHGPYLTKSCTGLDRNVFAQNSVTRLDLQDRNGSFLAIRWPDRNAEPLSITTLQDVFPAVLNRIFGTDAFNALRLPPVIPRRQRERLAGVFVDAGTIVGGADDGKRLYETHQIPGLSDANLAP